MIGRMACALRACVLLLALAPAGATAAEATSAPLTLREAIEAALAGNPELSGLEFHLRAQEARAKQAGLRPAAELSVELENFAGSGEVSGTDELESTFAMSQVIELGGKREARLDVAAAERGLIENDRAIRQLDVLADVTRRFITLAA